MSVSVRIDGADSPQVYESVVGHVLIAVVKNADSSLTIERNIGVNAEPGEDGETVLEFIKSVEGKLNKVLPEPDATPESKIWMPE